MGRQTIFFAMGISGLSGILGLLGLCLPLHRVSFWMGGALKVGDLQIFTVMGKLSLSDADICVAVRRFAKGQEEFCEDASGSHDLHDLSQRFCAPAIKVLFRGACEGMTAAYGLGILSIIFMVTNFILEGIAVWMMYHYMYNSPKKKFREVAFILVIVGTACVFLGLALYFPLVGLQLDNMKMAFGGEWVFTVSNGGLGSAVGYWLLWVAVLVQIAQIVLLKHSKLSEERRLVELKMQEQFEAELAVTGGDYGDYGGNGYPGDPAFASYDQYGGAAYGNDPYGANPYGGGGAYGQQPPSWGHVPSMSAPLPPQPAYGFGGYPAY